MDANRRTFLGTAALGAGGLVALSQTANAAVTPGTNSMEISLYFLPISYISPAMP